MTKLTWWVAALGFSVIVVLSWLQIGSRFVGGGFAWVTDATNLIYFWVIWPAIYVATTRGEHFVIDFLGPRLSPGAERWHKAAIDFIAVAYNLVIVIWGAQAAIDAMKNQFVFLPGISLFWELLVVPLVGLLLLSYSARRIWHTLHDGDST